MLSFVGVECRSARVGARRGGTGGEGGGAAGPLLQLGDDEEPLEQGSTKGHRLKTDGADEGEEDEEARPAKRQAGLSGLHPSAPRPRAACASPRVPQSPSPIQRTALVLGPGARWHATASGGGCLDSCGPPSSRARCRRGPGRPITKQPSLRSFSSR
jgi:hypothetical protein